MATYTSFSSNAIYSGKAKGDVEPKYSNSDILAPEVRLYIEGVQIPFISIVISQSINSLPTCSLQIPSASGLMDIGHGYCPKVHVFYKDSTFGGMRLLFWGNIQSTSYDLDRASASSSISFQCTHKNYIMQESFTLDYTGWASPNPDRVTDPNAGTQGSGSLISGFNSRQTIVTALGGITGIASSSEALIMENATTSDAASKLPVDKLPVDLSKLENRLKGMPGVILNLWQQIKRSALANPKYNLAILSMWVPILEENLSFFKRLSGHPVLEEKLQAGVKPYCHVVTPTETKVITPPFFQLPRFSAVSLETAVDALDAGMGFSGEMTSFLDLLRQLLEICEYDLETLSSPAEVPANPDTFIGTSQGDGVEKIAVETILKARIPSYFSPLCNVLFPRMYYRFETQYDQTVVPSRVFSSYKTLAGTAGATQLTQYFRAPQSVREAMCYNHLLAGNATPSSMSLLDSMSYSYPIPGKYELGTGIRPRGVKLNWWLSVLYQDKEFSGQSDLQEEVLDKTDPSYKNVMLLTAAWEQRYAISVTQEDGTLVEVKDPMKVSLNPYSLTNGLKPSQRLMMSAVDYSMTQSMRSARRGVVQGLFNPYIVVGYPVDVIQDGPNQPSFHAYCTSITHSISSSGIGTSIGLSSVTTYAELSNYYLPATPPSLTMMLNMVNGDVDEAKLQSSAIGDTSPFSNIVSTLLSNPIAKATADTYYKQVLGVPAVAPDDLIHFATNTAYSHVKSPSGALVPLVASNGSPLQAHEEYDSQSFSGNLRLVGRLIESLDAIEYKFSLKFVDLDPVTYSSTPTFYLNPVLASSLYLEPGASMFLDYPETPQFIQDSIKILK